jgi:hypothetical protein
MTARDAERIIGNLRYGIPPLGYLERFTVGRQSEIERLLGHLLQKWESALLIKSNYGSGKSHLLRLLREKALSEGFAVSFVSLDAQNGVNFGKMDSMMGAILRELEMPREGSGKGLGDTFDFVLAAAERTRASGENGQYWRDVTDGWKWDYTEELASPPLFIGLRAWATGEPEAREQVLDWFYEPENYRTQRRRLYNQLIRNLRNHFRDRRSEQQFYDDELFAFHTNGFQRCWETLDGLEGLLQAAGLKGLVILFDEFEDVLTNLRSFRQQEDAFWNLFLFLAGKRFSGKTYYAVTPDFADKCKALLMKKGRSDYDYEQFDRLPMFGMSPLDEKELNELGTRIADAHGCAYNYDPALVDRTTIWALVARIARTPMQDRSRYAIKEIVRLLDQIMEER